MPSGALVRDVHSLAIDPVTSSVLYAGTFSGAVFKIASEEASWVGISQAFSGAPVFALEINPTTPTTLYAGTTSGVFKLIQDPAR